jgi:hypothetical protein
MPKKPPIFKDNDYVKFEVDPSGLGPRWSSNKDKGYSGRWAEAVITEITSKEIVLDALFPDNEIKVVRFPNTGSDYYDPEQWWFPGYLRKVITKPICDCGCTDGTHWMFCPAWERI